VCFAVQDGEMAFTKKRFPEATAGQITKKFFGISDDQASNRSAVRRLLIGALEVAVLIPALFFLRFGDVSGLGWGTIIFFVVYCLLAAIGLQFRSQTRHHTPVAARGDWLDWIGAFWLVSCAFGRLLGWIATSVFPSNRVDLALVVFTSGRTGRRRAVDYGHSFDSVP
jgi:hypothetical protein